MLAISIHTAAVLCSSVVSVVRSFSKPAKLSQRHKTATTNRHTNGHPFAQNIRHVHAAKCISSMRWVFCCSSFKHVNNMPWARTHANANSMQWRRHGEPYPAVWRQQRCWRASKLFPKYVVCNVLKPLSLHNSVQPASQPPTAAHQAHDASRRRRSAENK